MAALVRPDEHDDPVGAVLAARRAGSRLALATSGTTGTRPRRVLRSTDSWWGSFDAYSELTAVRAGSRVWIPGPLRSTMNLFAAVHSAEVGAVIVDDPATATHACLTPTQLERLGSELPQGTEVVVAGARLPEGLATAAKAGGLRLAHYYGAAELSFVAATKGAAGLRAFTGVEIEIRDDPVAGTIWVRSPWVCDGYEGPPGSFVRDSRGWASVGDLGSLAEEVLTVRGRPDAIITAGATVLIADVEAVLRPSAHGAFAVHPVAHPTLGEVVGITVTDAADRATLDEAARRDLPVTHRPRVWRTASALPHTPAGKLDRASLSQVRA
jgi:acyl-CoA synthetase (AMP-forming)/AMP-acid ligase II